MTEWRLIETAPTEHLSRADLWVPGEGRVTSCTFSRAFDPPKWGKTHRDGRGEYFVSIRRATHWMPVPKPPAPGATAESGE